MYMYKLSLKQKIAAKLISLGCLTENHVIGIDIYMCVRIYSFIYACICVCIRMYMCMYMYILSLKQKIAVKLISLGYLTENYVIGMGK
jgi:hypothetical protein